MNPFIQAGITLLTSLGCLAFLILIVSPWLDRRGRDEGRHLPPAE